jgi:hypothetical protein
MRGVNTNRPDSTKNQDATEPLAINAKWHENRTTDAIE